MANRQNHVVRSQLLARLRDREEQAKFLANARNVVAWTKQERTSAEREAFISLLSHSLRTPLNNIYGFAQLLDAEVRGPLTDDQRRDVHRIQANERHLLNLVDSVISFARWDFDDSLTLEDVSVCTAVQRTDNAVTRAASEKGVVYLPSRNTIATDLVVRAEPSRLREILLQLMLNAVKFSRPNDSMAVDARVVGDRVWIRVTDTGIGIAEHDLALIFHPFVRGRDSYARSQDGVGLGLAITQKLARAMGGDLSVVSAPSGGSTFTLALPRGRGHDPSDLASPAAPVHSLRR
jgi:signal transduction histidine kinase